MNVTCSLTNNLPNNVSTNSNDIDNPPCFTRLFKNDTLNLVTTQMIDLDRSGTLDLTGSYQGGAIFAYNIFVGATTPPPQVSGITSTLNPSTQILNISWTRPSNVAYVTFDVSVWSITNSQWLVTSTCRDDNFNKLPTSVGNAGTRTFFLLALPNIHAVNYGQISVYTINLGFQCSTPALYNVLLFLPSVTPSPSFSSSITPTTTCSPSSSLSPTPSPSCSFQPFTIFGVSSTTAEVVGIGAGVGGGAVFVLILIGAILSCLLWRRRRAQLVKPQLSLMSASRYPPLRYPPLTPDLTCTLESSQPWMSFADDEELIQKLPVPFGHSKLVSVKSPAG